MVAGVELKILQSHPQPDILPKPVQFSPERYRIMSGREATSNLAPLEPDMLGELFVLERVRPASVIDEQRGSVLRNLSWNLKPQPMAAFLERTARDFPAPRLSSALAQVRGSAPGSLQLLSQVAVNATVYMSAARQM